MMNSQTMHRSLFSVYELMPCYQISWCATTLFRVNNLCSIKRSLSNDKCVDESLNTDDIVLSSERYMEMICCLFLRYPSENGRC